MKADERPIENTAGFRADGSPSAALTDFFTFCSPLAIAIHHLEPVGAWHGEAWKCVECNLDYLNPMKRQVWVVHRGSSRCIHDDRVSCRQGNVSPRYGQRLASGIPISPRCVD